MSTKNISDLKTQKDTLFPDTAGAISAADLRNVHEDELDSAFNRIDGETFRVVASPTGDASGYVLTVDYPTAYTDEIPILFKAPATNTNGNSFTIKVNSLAALPVYTVGQAQVGNGTLIINRWYSAIWSTSADGGGTDGFIIIQASNTFGDGTFDSITDGAGTGAPDFPFGFTINSQGFITGDDTVSYGYPYQVGTELNITGTASNVKITALTQTRIAYLDEGNSDLRTYDYSAASGTWSQTGNDLNIAGISNGISISALDSSSIAFLDSGNEDLRKYSFDGADWAQVGNDLNISGLGGISITALDSSSVAFFDTTNDDLRKYAFDGTNWSQVGNDLNITAGPPVWLTTLSSTRIAFIDNTNDDLRVYDFDGSSWSQTGSDFNISGAGSASITALSSTTVAYVDVTLESLRIYKFNGSTWSLVSHPFSVGTIGIQGVCALSDKSIAFTDVTNDDLLIYEWPLIWSKPPPAPPF